MPDPVAPVTISSNTAATQIDAELSKLFPGGILVDEHDRPVIPVEPAATGPAPAATGPAPAATGPAPAATGPAPAATGPAPAATGPAPAATGPVESAEQIATRKAAAENAARAADPLASASVIAAAIAKAMATGPTGPLPVVTGPTGPAASGPTGSVVSGPTGPTGITEAQRDAAEKAMAVEAGTAFKAVRTENKQLSTKLAETTKRLAEVEKEMAAIAPPEDYKALQKRVADYEAEFAAVRVEATDDFKKQVTIPMARAETELFELAKARKIPEGDLRAALNDPDLTAQNDKLAVLSEDLNRLETARFDRLVVDLNTTKRLRTEILATAGERYKAIQQTQQTEAARVAQELQESWTGALDTSFTKLVEELPIFQALGDEKWDAAMVAVRDRVKGTDIAKLSNEDIAAAFYKSGAFPLLLNVVSELYGQTTELNEMVTKLRGTAVPAGGGLVTPETTVIAPTTFAQAAKAALAGVLPP